ncbi:MAG: AmmeMemoRadiSam system protein A [Psychrobium sp.]|nr:AmmeMemoRadiSam system protein A [Psychrobium sp.]
MPVLSCFNFDKKEQTQLIDMVRQVIIAGVANQQFMLPQAPVDEKMLRHGACFITLYIDGNLRGCIGTCISSKPLWVAACEYGFNSAFNDLRFSPLRTDELDKLVITISILSDMQPIENLGEAHLIDNLLVNVDGLRLSENQQGSVFLPIVWQSLPKPSDFVLQLKRKGGWADDYWSADIKLHRFSTFLCQ